MVKQAPGVAVVGSLLPHSNTAPAPPPYLLVVLGHGLAEADGLDDDARVLEHRRPRQVAERHV